jgi:hypothetical protein
VGSANYFPPKSNYNITTNINTIVTDPLCVFLRDTECQNRKLAEKPTSAVLEELDHGLYVPL